MAIQFKLSRSYFRSLITIQYYGPLVTLDGCYSITDTISLLLTQHYRSSQTIRVCS